MDIGVFPACALESGGVGKMPGNYAPYKPWLDGNFARHFVLPWAVRAAKRPAHPCFPPNYPHFAVFLPFFAVFFKIGGAFLFGYIGLWQELWE